MTVSICVLMGNVEGCAAEQQRSRRMIVATIELNFPVHHGRTEINTLKMKASDDPRDRKRGHDIDRMFGLCQGLRFHLETSLGAARIKIDVNKHGAWEDEGTYGGEYGTSHNLANGGTLLIG